MSADGVPASAATTVDQPLRQAEFLSFPLRIGPGGPRLSGRVGHVREMIEQVLLTAPGERIFRPEWGAGARSLVFEPASSPLADLVGKRLRAVLADVLTGEVDPRSLTVDVQAVDDRLEVVVAYTLATIGRREEQRVALEGGGG
jgi:uncharacterized protein